MSADNLQKRAVLADLLADLGAEAAPEVGAWMQAHKPACIVQPWDENDYRRPLGSTNDFVGMVYDTPEVERGPRWYWAAYKPEPDNTDLGSGYVETADEARAHVDEALRSNGFVLLEAA